jgi:hypothetical protein
MTTIATLVKRFTLWKAQKGATVAELEQYQASISLPSTLKMIVLLRAFSWASLALVSIWTFYYLGSQAVSREYTYQSLGTQSRTEMNLTFLSSDAPSAFSFPAQLSSVNVSRINSAFSVALLEPPQQQGLDYNLAILTPMLNRTETAQWPTNPPPPSWNGHGLIGDTFEAPIYSSAVGITLFPTNFVGTVGLSTTYIFANCADPIAGNSSDFPSGISQTLNTAFNVTGKNDNGYPQVEIWKRNDKYDTSIHAVCNLETRNIFINIHCDTKSCAAVQYNSPYGKSTLPIPAKLFVDPEFSRTFFKNLMLSDGTPANQEELTSWEAGATVTYLEDAQTWADFGSSNASADLAWALSYDFTMLTNTYLRVSQQWGPLTMPIYDQTGNLDIPASGTTWSNAYSYGAFYQPEYVLSIFWIVIDFLTCTILLLAALASCWLRVNTVAPDIFGCEWFSPNCPNKTNTLPDVSSLTRDNPNMHLPDGGSTMSGVERAKALRNIKVKIADIDGHRGVGHIGLAVVHPDVKMGNLVKARQYV